MLSIDDIVTYKFNDLDDKNRNLLECKGQFNDIHCAIIISKKRTGISKYFSHFIDGYIYSNIRGYLKTNHMVSGQIYKEGDCLFTLEENGLTNYIITPISFKIKRIYIIPDLVENGTCVARCSISPLDVPI